MATSFITPAFRNIVIPHIDYASLPAEFQTPEYQTSEGRMALAKYYVAARSLDPPPGIEYDTPAAELRLRSIAKYCLAELRIAYGENFEKMARESSDNELKSCPCWVRGIIKVIDVVGKPFAAISNALDRILPAGRAGELIFYGAGLLFFSGGFYFVARKNPPLALVIGTGLGAAAGTALLCAGIYLAIKQKYYQGRQ